MTLTCAECIGVCCTAAGAITVTDEDKTTLAEFLGLSSDEFQSRYVTVENDQEIIKSHFNPCQFLKEGNCSVHKARPEVCREYFCWNRRDLSYNIATRLYKSGIRTGRITIRQTDNSIGVEIHQ